MFSPPPGGLNGRNGSAGAEGSQRGVHDYLDALRNDPVVSRLASSFIAVKATSSLGPIDALTSVVQADRLVVLSSPGMGKTTLLKAAAHRAAGRGDERPARIPIYVDLARAREGEGVDETVARALADFGPRNVSLAECAPALLLLDNLDRATDVYMLEGLELLTRAGGRAGPAVVAACRTGEWPAYRTWFDDVATVELAPLSPKVVRDILRRRLPLDVAEAAVAWLDRDGALAAAVQRPLALASFLRVAQDRAADEWRRRHVLDALLESFLAGVPSIERPAYRSALSDVALRSLEAGLPVEVDTVAMALGVNRDDMIRTGAVEANGSLLTFVEPLLAHHCAASALSRHASTNPRKLAEHLGDLNDPRRADTLVHVYNLAPDPVEFLAALIPLEGGPEITARCLAEPDAADPGGPSGSTAVVEGLVAGTPPLPVRSLYRLGEALSRSGQVAAAEIALRAALARTEGDVDLDAIFGRSDVDDAPPVSEWVKDYIRSRNTGIANRAMPTADPSDALGAFSEATSALGKLDAEVTFERGLAALDAGDTEQALADLAAAVATEPHRARYLYHYGRILASVGRADEAIEHLRNARDRAPEAVIEAALAEAYLQQGWLEEAISCFESAARMDPQQPTYLQAVGELIAESGDLEAAAETMREACGRRPDQAGWHDGLGQVLAELGRYADAADAFKAAHELEPERPDLLRRLGRALSLGGNFDAALAALRKAIDLSPDDAASQAELGHCLARAGQSEAALTSLRRAISGDAGWPADHVLMSRLMREMGDLDTALRHARLATELAPASASALTELGRVYESRGEQQNADDVFQRAARRAGRDTLPLDDQRPARMATNASPPWTGPATNAAPPWSDPASSEGSDTGESSIDGAPGSVDPEHDRRTGWLSVQGLLSRGGGKDKTQTDEGQDVPSTAAAVDELMGVASDHEAAVGGTHTQPGAKAEGGIDAGLEKLAVAAEDAPDDPDVLRAYGIALRAAGYAEKAIGILRRAARLSPEQWELLWELARTAFILGRLNEARYAVGAAQEIAGDHASLLALLGEIETAAGNSEAAGEAYARAMALDPANATIADRARQLGYGRHDGSAVEDVATARFERDDKTSPTQQNQLGQDQFGQGSAASDVRAATARQTGHVLSARGATGAGGEAEDALSQRLADLHAEAGDWELAAAEYERARSARPSDPELAAAHAAALRQAGRPEAAVEAIERLAAARADSHVLLAEMGASLLACNRVDDALEQYERAVKLGGGAATALAWSRVALKAGAMDDAIEGARHSVVEKPEWADGYAALAAAYRASGLPEAALTAISRAAALDPHAVGHRVLLAQIATQLQRFDDAVAALEVGLDTAPSSGELHHALGEVFAARGWQMEAAEHFTRAIGLEPDVSLYHRSLAALLAEDDPDAAAAALRDALETNPKDAETAHALGQLHYRAGDDEAALQLFKRAVKHAPGNGEFNRSLALCLARLGDETAAEAFERTLELEPEDPGALAGMGALHADRGNRRDAIMSFERAARLAPDDASLWRRLGQLYLADGDAEAAVAAFTEAVRVEPGNAGGHRTVGMALEALGRPFEAARSFEEALRLDPNDTDALVRLGRARLATSDAEGAVEALERALVIDSTNGNAMIALAEAVHTVGRAEAALGYAKRAAELAPDDPDAWHVLADIAKELRQLDVAAAALERAVDLNPSDADTHRLLAEIALDRGDLEAALDSYRELVVVAPEDISAAVRFGEMVAQSGWELVPVAPELTPKIDIENAQTAVAVLESLLWPGTPDGDEPEPHGDAQLEAQSEAQDEAKHAAPGASRGRSRGAPTAPAEELDPRLVARATRALAFLRGRLGDAEGALEAAHVAADGWETPRNLVAVAWASLLTGDTAAALEALGLARALEADGADVHMLAATAHSRRGDFSLAAEAYRLATARMPELAEAHAGLGAMHAELGRAEKALDSYRKAIELNATAEWCREVGRLALQCGHLNEALDALAAYTSDHPEQPEPRRDLAMVRYADGDVEGAIRDLARAVTLAPDRPDWHAELGDLYKGQGQLEQAHEAYRRASEMDPGNAKYRMAEAKVLLEEGNIDEARAKVKAALDANAGDHEAHALLGRIALQEGDVEGAREAFTKALDRDPSNPEFHYFMGMTAKSHGDLGQALDHLESSARLDARDPKTYIALGELYQQTGAIDDAIQALEQAAVCEKGIEAHMRLGDLCTRQGMIDKALAHYERAAELAPGDYRPRQGMAHAYLARQDLERAVEAFEDAIERGPRAAEVYFDAGMAYKRLRDYGRAAEMFKRATRLAPGSAAAYTQLAAVSALHFLDRSGKGEAPEKTEATE